jgi:hypothetical protein
MNGEIVSVELASKHSGFRPVWWLPFELALHHRDKHSLGAELWLGKWMLCSPEEILAVL